MVLLKKLKISLTILWTKSAKDFLPKFIGVTMMILVSNLVAWFYHAFFHFVMIILEESVAIKAIDMKGVRDPAAREMLEYEIQALNVLNHKNIMKCFCVVKQSLYCYIITELCNGGDLGALLKKKGRFDQNETIRILKGIVKGYIEIGSKGFLHRDLKLANVLLSNGEAKIADFGFSKKCKAQTIKQKYNVGSPLYMSPEALKHNIYSMKNDIWSIGIMAYEMLHGDTPWKCSTQRQLIDKMTKIPVKFNEAFKLSNDTKDFIRKCLQVTESKRMSLSGLKEWINEIQGKTTSRQNNENMPIYDVKLVPKPTTFDKLQTRPLSELTNRINNNKNGKSLNKIKVPLHEASAREQLSKSTINYNNNILIKQMIVFRLFFKALQKLKSTAEFEAPAQLKSILGNETIRRVTLLKKLICSEELTANQYFSLRNVELYLNPINNPDIKKYKNVVNEYFNKYMSQVKIQMIESKSNPSELIAAFLKTLDSTHLNKESLLIHWLINLRQVSTRLSKGELESILEPKQEINCDYLKYKIQQMCV